MHVKLVPGCCWTSLCDISSPGKYIYMRKKTKIILLLALAIILCSAYLAATHDYRKYPLLGKDMIANVTVLEDHRDALAHWSRKGFKNAVLMNIDAHDDMKRVPPRQMAQVKLACRQREEVSGAKKRMGPPLANGNFIHAAARMGIIGRVIWVVPTSYDLFSDPGNRLQALLTAYGFSADDISTFRLKKGSFTGTVDGIPLLICDSRSLPDLKEPIILTIDVDFFPAMLADHNLNITAALKQTFSNLSSKGYAIMDATVAYSVNGGFLDSCHRWVGDLVIDAVRIPGLLSLPRIPERYEFLQQADLLMQMKRYGELLAMLPSVPPDEERDPALLLYAAKAYHGIAELDKAFRYAETACLRDNRYCGGLPELGASTLEKGVGQAERFFLRGYELSPEMDNGQFRLAMALKKAGRYDGAIDYFKVFREGYGPFPVDFYLAETCLLKGDESSARMYYDSGREELIGNPSMLNGYGDMATLEKGAAFYERKGDAEYASQIRALLKARVANEESFSMVPLLY